MNNKQHLALNFIKIKPDKSGHILKGRVDTELGHKLDQYDIISYEGGGVILHTIRFHITYVN